MGGVLTPRNFSGLMLPEDDPAVQAFLLALESSNQKRRKSEEDLLQNMAEGLSWPKCHEKHAECKRHLADALGTLAASPEILTHYSCSL